MAKSRKYKFYIITDASAGTEISLEDDFEGLSVLKIKGLNDRGEVKNVYTEKYAEGDSLRVYAPTSPKLDSTKVTFTLAFTGENRASIYERLYDIIAGKVIGYYDTAFGRRIDKMILSKAVTLSEDVTEGNEPYMVASFEFTNLKGTSTRI